MPVLEKLKKGAVSAGIAGTLAVSMGLGAAAPANALLPVLPVVAGAVGGTAVGASVSGWAIAGYAALTGATLLASQAIRENSSVWMKDLTDFFSPAPPAGKSMNSVPYPNPGGSSGVPKEDGSYVWIGDGGLAVMNPAAGGGIRWDKFEWDTPYGKTAPINRVSVDMHYGGGWLGNSGPRLIFVLEAQCKDRNGGPTYNETRYMKDLTQQFHNNNGDRDRTFTFGCADHSKGELVAYRLRPPTTAEKHNQLGIPPTTSYYDYYFGPAKEYVGQAPNSALEDPGYRATVECFNKATGVKTSLSLDSGYSADGKVGIPSCAAAGLGEVASSLAIDFIDGGRTVTPAYRTIPKSDTLLECDPAFGNFCKLEIYIDGIPCVIGTVACAGWISQHQADSSRVKCYYGSREVDISNCGVLEGAYVHGGSPWTSNNTDGLPATWDDPNTVPNWQPRTGPNGEPAQNPAGEPGVQPNPNETPYAQPQPGTDPGTGTTSPGTGTTSPTFPTSGANPSSTVNCAAPTWNWNPIEFVLQPVVCAMQQAFIPKTDITARVTELQTIAGGKAPLSWMNPVMTGPGGGGCPAWVMNVPGFFSQNVVCGSSFTAAIVGARGPLFGLVAGAMVWPLFRSLWYAAIPVLRVTPASSK